MLFSSLLFLSIFLPVVTLLYFMVKQELRNYVLLIASLIFYAWGESRYLPSETFILILYLGKTKGLIAKVLNICLSYQEKFRETAGVLNA